MFGVLRPALLRAREPSEYPGRLHRRPAHGCRRDLRHHYRRNRPLRGVCDGFWRGELRQGHRVPGVSRPAGLGAPILLGAAAALLIGLIPGLVNGTLVARLNVPPFLATFGMYGIAYGFSEIISKNTPISGLPPLAGVIGNEYLLYLLPGKSLWLFSRPDDLVPLELRRLVPLLPNIVVISLRLRRHLCLRPDAHALWPAHLCPRRQPGRGAAGGHQRPSPSVPRLHAVVVLRVAVGSHVRPEVRDRPGRRRELPDARRGRRRCRRRRKPVRRHG